MYNEFTAIIERDEDWFVAYCAEIPGANGQGRTAEEARASLGEAIALILEGRGEDALRGAPESISDTTPRVTEYQLELYRQAGPARRAQIAADLSDAVRETTMAGIRRRHPEYSEREVADEFLRLVYGFGLDRFSI